MTRAPYYTARHALVWSSQGPRTITEAEQHARDFLDMALTERDARHSVGWMAQLSELVSAIRQAKEQERALPVERMVA